MRVTFAERRKLGIPFLDTNTYARENGWNISGLVALYAATGETGYLAEAERAAPWVLTRRALPDGAFRHGNAAHSRFPFSVI